MFYVNLQALILMFADCYANGGFWGVALYVFIILGVVIQGMVWCIKRLIDDGFFMTLPSKLSMVNNELLELPEDQKRQHLEGKWN